MLHCAGSSQVCIVLAVWQCRFVEFVKTDLIWLIAGHFSQVSGRGIFIAFFFWTVPRKSERVVIQLRRMRVGCIKKNSRPGMNCLSVAVFVVVSFLYAYVITSYRSYLIVITILIIIIIIIIAMYVNVCLLHDLNY